MKRARERREALGDARPGPEDAPRRRAARRARACTARDLAPAGRVGADARRAAVAGRDASRTTSGSSAMTRSKPSVGYAVPSATTFTPPARREQLVGEARRARRRRSGSTPKTSSTRAPSAARRPLRSIAASARRASATTRSASAACPVRVAEPAEHRVDLRQRLASAGKNVAMPCARQRLGEPRPAGPRAPTTRSGREREDGLEVRVDEPPTAAASSASGGQSQ